jgi:hypothetical protein
MMGLWNSAHQTIAVKAYYKNNDSYMSAQRVFWNHCNIPHNDPVPSAHGLKTSRKWAVHWRNKLVVQKVYTRKFCQIGGCSTKKSYLFSSLACRVAWHFWSQHKEDFTQRSPVPSV